MTSAPHAGPQPGACILPASAVPYAEIPPALRHAIEGLRLSRDRLARWWEHPAASAEQRKAAQAVCCATIARRAASTLLRVNMDVSVADGWEQGIPSEDLPLARALVGRYGRRLDASYGEAIQFAVAAPLVPDNAVIPPVTLIRCLASLEGYSVATVRRQEQASMAATHAQAYVRFGEAVREARLQADVTQDELARKAGITPAVLHGIEAGGLAPLMVAAQLAAALGLSLDALCRQALGVHAPPPDALPG